jgi:hypothetical protein
MNDGARSRGTNTAATLAGFVLRHGVASLATVVAACAIWTVTYLVLLLWAIAANGGLGGPLAYPGGLLVVALAAGLASLFLFFPATALAELACRRKALPILAQIPISVALLAALCVLAAFAIEAFRDPPATAPVVARLCAWAFGLSLVPIGFYWWIAQAGPLLRAALRLLPSSHRG